MINATIVGRLGKDPEVRDTSHGSVCSVSVAADHGYGANKTTTWVKLSAWRGLGDTLNKLRKGCRVVASGELYEDVWTDRDNVDHKSLKLDANKISVIDWADEKPAQSTAPANQPKGTTKRKPAAKPQAQYQMDPDLF